MSFGRIGGYAEQRHAPASTGGEPDGGHQAEYHVNPNGQICQMETRISKTFTGLLGGDPRTVDDLGSLGDIRDATKTGTNPG